MALSTLASVQAIPGMSGYESAFLETLIDAASKAIKNYTKRELERATYTEYYSGNGMQDLVLRQTPVISITSFYLDSNGYWGQGASSFGAASLLTEGTQYALVRDEGSQSNRGLVRRIGGGGAGVFAGWNPEVIFGGKLSASRLPTWPKGMGNIKVVYVAGYSPVPADLQYACNMLVCWMARSQPLGGPTTSEGWEGYSYSLASSASAGTIPELGSVGLTLRSYRESSI